MKGNKNSHIPQIINNKVKNSVYLYPGDFHFAVEPTIIHTVLGSCVSVTLFDPWSRYGAMCHAVLDSDPTKKRRSDCTRFMDFAIDKMVEKYVEHNIPVQNLVVKVFGGARMLDRGQASSSDLPGERNIRMAEKKIAEYGCRVSVMDCGGTQGRRIVFFSHSGEVYLKRIKISSAG